MKLKNYTSIILSHKALNEFRSDLMRTSLMSLISTVKHLPVEIIVVDNGDNENDSKFLLNLCQKRLINCYIRNSEDMNAGFAGNQARDMAKGENVLGTCNDILYQQGWLDECLKILNHFPDQEKVFVSPIDYPGGLQKRYHVGNVTIEGKIYKKSTRAGSNCMLMRRVQLDKLGYAPIHRKDGAIFIDRMIQAGFFGVVTQADMVTDAGYRKGRNFNEILPIKRTLVNYEVVCFNEDEYKKQHPENYYYEY